MEERQERGPSLLEGPRRIIGVGFAVDPYYVPTWGYEKPGLDRLDDLIPEDLFDRSSSCRLLELPTSSPTVR